ncbi:GNAT family N-acetyltransferase [bacterium]|nr:GNAT family N-acetyltransferase [bacterium]
MITNNYDLNSVSFGAKFVRNANIEKLIPGTADYAKSKVSFVRIDPDNLGDIKALAEVASCWEHEKFANTIYNRAKSLRESAFDLKSKVYALISQRDNFKRLEPANIMGLVEVEEYAPKSIRLNHIQVNPQYIYLETPPVRGIGSAILRRLKDIYSQIILNSLPESSVRHFYEKNGFQRVSEDKLKYYWQKDKFFMI